MKNNGRSIKNCTWYHSGYNSFICLLIIYLINILYLSENFMFCRFYLNDLLAMPMLLIYTNSLYKLFDKKMQKYIPIVLLVICCIVWEILTPIIKITSVGDYNDIIMYIIGTIAWLVDN